MELKLSSDFNQNKYFAKAKSSERFERKIALKEGQHTFIFVISVRFQKIYEDRIVNSIYFDDEDFFSKRKILMALVLE